MVLPKEKVNRIQEMIGEYKNIESFIEREISDRQIRLDENRKRRAILQDLLETNMDY